MFPALRGVMSDARANRRNIFFTTILVCFLTAIRKSLRLLKRRKNLKGGWYKIKGGGKINVASCQCVCGFFGGLIGGRGP